MAPGQGMTFQQDWANWIGSGLTVGHTGEIDRSVTETQWGVPAKVWADGERLRYDIFHEDDGPSECSPDREVLAAFVELSEPAEIAAYASKYGVLAICEHGWPATHVQTDPVVTGDFGCLPLGTAEHAAYDPIGSWLYFGREARAMLNIGAAIRTGEPGVEADWRVLLADPAPVLWDPPNPDQLKSHRFMLAKSLDRWMAIGDVRMEISWFEGDRPSLRLAPRTLFAGLATQLALAVSGVDGLATCSNCATPYMPSRKPAKGRRNYCPSCAKTARWRDSKRTTRGA